MSAYYKPVRHLNSSNRRSSRILFVIMELVVCDAQIQFKLSPLAVIAIICVVMIFTKRLFNQASQVFYSRGTINQLSYYGFGRLSQLKYKSTGQQTLLQRQYQNDPMSNITRMDENKLTNTNNTTSNTTNVYLYLCDKLYRLTNADNPTFPTLALIIFPPNALL